MIRSALASRPKVKARIGGNGSGLKVSDDVGSNFGPSRQKFVAFLFDLVADSVDEITIAGFSGVHGHDLDAGFATYDTAAVSTGSTIVSVSLYGGDSAARSTSLLGLLELGVPRL